jgi:hypothetical protein
MPDAPQSELGARFDAIYKEMRAADITVRKFERMIATELSKMAKAQQAVTVATTAIRSQERWLKKKAAILLRKEAGIHTIPGFKGTTETATDMRRRINDKVTSIKADALAKIIPR